MRLIGLCSALALTLMVGCDDGETADPVADAAVENTPDGQMPEPEPEPEPEPPAGLPEGESTWSGMLQIAGQPFPLELTLQNTAGDLTGQVAFDSPIVGSGTYAVTGTWSPSAARIALAPTDWIVEPSIELELLGFIGGLEDGQLVGRAIDYASGSDNSLRGGPGMVELRSGDGAPTVAGDGARALPEGASTFSGTMRCNGPEREVQGTLEHDGEGRLTGTLTYGDLTLAENPATFEISGVHNPSTGGITLVPGVYVSEQFDLLTFFVGGAYDPQSGEFVGNLRQTIGACPEGLWRVTVE